jgi:poly-gamma-glutamate capsule biosynthesis protein CapA/YwtB (metallophosphatase superfamily)
VLSERLGVASFAAIGLALSLGAGAGSATTKPIRVTSTLPSWVAPGGRFVVRGLADPHELVTLKAGTWVISRARSGSRGRYVLEVRLRALGARTLSVVADGVAQKVGRIRVRPLRLAAVGDVTFGGTVGDMIRRYGPRYPWLRVARVLRRADVAVANLETAVSNRGAPIPGKQYTFRGPPRALRAMAKFAGVDVASLANNHSLDYGRVAFADTRRHARRLGLATIGGGRNLARARRPAVLELGGLRVAFLGFSDVRPPGFDAGPSRSGTTPAFPDLIAADVRRARTRFDVVVVYFHWGAERVFTPNARQRWLAGIALRSGAKVVLGAHPHVLQPRERRGARRRKLVAWSLGNFVFTGSSEVTRQTGILQVKLGRRGVIRTSFRRAHIVNSQPQLR